MSHGTGGGRACSPALELQGLQTALNLTRSGREGRRLRTRPRSSGGRSDQDEEHAASMVQPKRHRVQSFGKYLAESLVTEDLYASCNLCAKKEPN